MITVYVKDKVYIKASALDLQARKYLKEKLTFKYFEFRGKDKISKTISLLQTIKKKDILWLKIYTSIDYIVQILNELNIDFVLSDLRAKLTLEKVPIFLGELRDYQEDIIQQLEEHSYNAIIEAPTGCGKSFLSVYLTTKLKTVSLFTASKSSYLQSYKSEIINNVENGENLITEINSEWLKGERKITPFLICPIQNLYKEEFAQALMDKVGLLIADEIHASLLGNSYIDGIYSCNFRYKIFLSATVFTKAPNFIETACSINKVSIDTKVDFKIKYHPISISLPHLVSEYKATDFFHEKKKIIFSQDEFIPSLTNFIKHITELDRNILLFCTDKTFQESVSAMLNARGIESVCLNSNTKKKDIEKILSDYEDGRIKVLVSGASSIEALSLYRLSVFIDVDLSDSENTIIQKLGRLKRFKKEISDKSKIYIKFLYKSMTDSKFTYIIKPVVTNKKLSQYTDLQPTLYTNGFMFEEIFEEIFS